ncbi:MAG: arsenic transporter [Dehalococcoidales bacterium]|nr:arsenic transporter [Dehalococcoidales bacterium]
MFLALAIFIPAIALVMIRPRPLNEATASALGAAVMILTAVVSPDQAWDVLKENAGILLFFLGLMVISIIADQAGFFEWCAFKSVRLAKGSSKALLGLIFGLGSVLTAFFSNDATALVLTPIVFVIVTRLKLNPLPFVFACAFIANAASMLLPVSNPVNLLAVERFHLTLGEFLKHLLIPGILIISLNFGIFMIIFRRVLSPFQCDNAPDNPVKIDRYFLAVTAGLVIIAAGYIIVSVYGLPLSYPAAGGAVLLLVCSLLFRRLNIKKVASGISWSVFLFIFALAVMVRGLENAGVTQFLADKLAEMSSSGQLQALLSVTFGTALGSNLINNWSMMMVSVSSLSAQGTGLDSILVYGAIMGADLGPNIAILGSLSSILWLSLLKKRGLDIHPLQFIKLGLIVTPAVMVIGVLALYLCAGW